jgi:hypothetical protein
MITIIHDTIDGLFLCFFVSWVLLGFVFPSLKFSVAGWRRVNILSFLLQNSLWLVEEGINLFLNHKTGEWEISRFLWEMQLVKRMELQWKSVSYPHTISSCMVCWWVLVHSGRLLQSPPHWGGAFFCHVLQGFCWIKRSDLPPLLRFFSLSFSRKITQSKPARAPYRMDDVWTEFFFHCIPVP